MNLQRLPGETDLQYHKRIVYGKLKDGTLADIDYSEMAMPLYGKSYSSDSVRKMMYGSYETLQLLDRTTEEQSSKNMLEELERKRIEMQKERQKYSDYRASYTKLLREQAREDEIKEMISDAVCSGAIPTLEYVPSFVPHSDTTLLVSMNDIHYGANVQNYWNTYNSDVCKDMMRTYLDNILNIRNLHGSDECVVCANGDLISGNIHYSIAVTNKENVIQQIIGVSELLAEFIAELSKHFRHVLYVSVAGNHSRINPNKDKTISSERLDDLVEWYLEARLHEFDNVTIESRCRIDPTVYVIDVRGKTYVGVHGDNDITVSRVQALQTMVGRPVYAILSGHLHHTKIEEINGVKTIMAGSFLGMDEHCVLNRIVGNSSQLVCVVNDSGVVCTYEVPLA